MMQEALPTLSETKSGGRTKPWKYDIRSDKLVVIAAYFKQTLIPIGSSSIQGQ
jgi:hypothetical protein